MTGNSSSIFDQQPEDSELHETANAVGNIDGSKEEQSRTAYLSLRNNDMIYRRSDEIMRAVSKENPKSVHPLYALRSKSAFKLVFPTKEARDKAVVEKLNIFDSRVDVEPARTKPTTKKRTLHLFGIPIQENSATIEDWLKANGANIESDFRWLTYPETEIRTGGRSIVVSTPIEMEIPAYGMMESGVQKKRIPVTIWYHGIALWCRKCCGKGHKAKDCTSEPFYVAQQQQVVDPNSYAERAKGGFKATGEGVPKTTATDIPESRGSSPQDLEQGATAAPMVTLMSQAAISSRLTPRPEITQEIVPFCPETSVFSNNYRSPFMADWTSQWYKSTEQYLFGQKAKTVGDTVAEKKIMEADTAAEAKRIGEMVEWDVAKCGSWHKFAYKQLRTANRKKYEYNTEIRRALFETAPKRLAEANPYDLHWGAGMNADNPEIHDPTNWKGKNVFGNMLTKLRDQMMATEEFKPEVEQLKGRRENEAAKKRLRSESSSDGGDEVAKAARISESPNTPASWDA